MNTVAIIGVGLIGGSFGLALRKTGFSGEILGVSSASALAAGIHAGAISRMATLEEAAVADLIYLAQPVNRILATLAHLGPLVSAHSLITDAGSTKAAIVRQAREHVTRATFLGGHPLAGKEQRGAEAADPDLFRNRPYVLTPVKGSQKGHVEEKFRDWLNKIGAQIVDMPPEEHDHIVALTSHLPQMLSTALANTLAGERGREIGNIFGPGLIDMTRLALSSPELWESIVSSNKSEILAAMDTFAACFQSVRQAVEEADITRWFVSGATLAATLRNPSVTSSTEID